LVFQKNRNFSFYIIILGFRKDGITEEDNFRCCKVLVDAGADVNARNTFDETILHKMAALNYSKCLKLFIDNKGDVNVQNEEGWTPLHYAVRGESIECLQILIESKADVNIVNDDEATPLHLVGCFMGSNTEECLKMRQILCNNETGSEGNQLF
jgi:ankyrin repeat protein